MATTEPSVREFRFERGRVCATAAWTLAEVLEGVERLVAAFEARLPRDRDARILVKPNLNNDLVALTGNSVDHRVLRGLVEALRRRGYGNLCVADGCNVGMEWRGLSALSRLRIDRLCAWLGVDLLDLNAEDGPPMTLAGGARPRVAAAVLEADFLISVPKVKTHCEAMLSCAMKNWVGITVAQDKRHMHYDLCRNIFLINEVVRPHLVLVDGLVGMEGNGPGDGEPFRLGWLVASDDAFINDVVVARMVGLDTGEVPYLVHARAAGHIDDQLLAEVTRQVEVVRPIKRPPPRTRLARLADVPALAAAKRAVRPITNRPAVSAVAHRLGVIQDVYGAVDDGVRRVRRTRDDCGSCNRCAEVCPTGLERGEIGRTDDPARCTTCLYCYLVCPSGALQLDGPLGHLARQIERYKRDIEQL